MMAALSGWLGRVVAVVLLASLIDLLLPSRTMQRYVRLVAGLLVLLTIATPALSLFRSGFADELTADIQAVKRQYRSDSSELSRIEADGRKLGAAREEQAAQLATAKLSAEIRAAVEQAGLGSVRALDIRTEPDGNGGRQVSAVELTLDAEVQAGAGESGKADGSAAAGGPIADVKPVAPIDIRIGAGSEADGDGGDGDTAGAEDAVPAAGGNLQQAGGDLAGKVKSLLASRFGVAPNEVKVWQAEPGTAG